MKKNELLQEMEDHTATSRRKRKWLTAAVCLAAAVVFCITYALILPALTLDKDQTLVCSYTVHQHDAGCYDGEGTLICGYADYVVHTHQEDYCYDENGNLVCELEEIAPHEHEEPDLHIHSDACYDADGNLVCGKLQTEAHQHDETCVVQKEKDEDIAPLNNPTEERVPITDEKILQELAEEGIYPGTCTVVDGSEVWTVYNAGTEGDSTVKATVTLPKGTKSAEKSWLYIRKVQPGEGYYPDAEKLKETAGVYNDMQCYAIHWVKVYEEDGQWKYDLATESILDEKATATVKIEYLQENEYLKGKQANRKLQVYNSRQYDGKLLEEAGTPIDVTANADAYTGFTYTTNRGGPYVFVSKYLYEGYVSSITVNSIIDGVDPFDANDEAGNDSGDSNRIVRSYDTISYNLTANFAARSNVSTAKSAELGFEMILDADVTEATFDLSGMRWLRNNYTIDYLDENNKVVLTRNHDGTYIDETGKKITLNDIASGSDKGTDSYTTKIVSQRLRGSLEITAEQNLLAGNRDLSAAVQVLNAGNGSKIHPVFRAWFVGNEDNYDSESGNGDEVHPAEKVTANQQTAEAVTVSAAARFNLEIGNNSNVSYKGWFDSSSGKEVNEANTDSYTVGTGTVTGAQLHELLEKLADLEENTGKSKPEEFTDQDDICNAFLYGHALNDYAAVFQHIRYGRITGYGITLQVYNEATNSNDTASKGFKGVSLPQGEIGFDLDLSSSVKVTDGKVNTAEYESWLWEYNENVNADKGNAGKNMYWANLGSTKYAAWAAPYNSGGGASGCYTGGSWNLDNTGGYHFTVSGYDFNFLTAGIQYPTHKAGNSTATDGYNTYIGSFSAGYVQVLNVFPRYQSGTLNMYTDITVKNLTLETTNQVRVAPEPSDSTGYKHETKTTDNSRRDEIPLYARGGMTKANAFCTAALFDKKAAEFSSKQYFLGTDFWGTSYDCSAFAGQSVTLVGAARINAGDYKIRHMNMLQLFDSEVLSITEGKTPYVISRVTDAKEGNTTILYAADPDYPQGYNTNDKTVMDYMSTVREEDLIYYESLDALEKAGYTCIGIMAELRNWSINGEGGYSTALKIAMDVSDDGKYLGKTIGTVNTVRIWTNAADMKDGTVSWKDGRYDPAKKKNSVEGYTPMQPNSDEHYLGQVANAHAYVKTQYENGQVVYDTNAGGYVYGTSLLILGYKSKVDIAVDNGGEGSLPTYDLDKGGYTVEYRLNGIKAEVDEDIGKAQETGTNLTILAKLDTDRNDGGTDQRIAVTADSYCMKPSSDKMVLTDENGNPLASQSVDVSSDADHPTTVHYAFVDEATGKVDTSKVYTIQVYAHRDTNGRQVSFELQDVTVNVSLPDITYDALLVPEAVKNNDRIHTSAYISGTSDVRAYSDTAGNMDRVTIGVVQLTATRLVKSVNKSYIELDEDFTYTVSYTNGGNEPVNLYLYDLLPDADDSHGSHYKGEAILRKIAADLSGEGDFTANIQFYYSTRQYSYLNDLVSTFGDENGKSTAAIERMLHNKDLFTPLGSITSANNHVFQISDELKALKALSPEKLTEEMRKTTGIYAVVSNLSGGKTLSIRMTVEADGNQTGNLYRNVANSWLGNASEPLTSNMVETTVLSRAISGVVWYDADLDGVRDSDEELLSGVNCTLFKKDETTGAYEAVTGNGGPNQRNIIVPEWDAAANEGAGGYVDREIADEDSVQMITTSDGAYRFGNLTSGEYIVAFSGEALKKYTGATTYQANGSNDNATNDAVALIDTNSNMDKTASITGIDNKTYSYAIAYSLTETTTEDKTNITVDPVSMHTIPDIVDKDIMLTNNVELYENQDLGLVIAGYEMPETGGTGTAFYRIAGPLLMVTGGIFLLYYKKRRKEDTASS